MNLDELNYQHLEVLANNIAGSRTLEAHAARLKDLRPDDLMVYALGSYVAHPSFDAQRDEQQRCEPLPPEDDELLEPGLEDVENSPDFWRGVFEARGSIKWKQESGSTRTRVNDPSAGLPRYPCVWFDAGLRLNLGLWRWLDLWGPYVSIAPKVRDQVRRGSPRVILHGVDALLFVRSLYPRADVFAVLSKDAESVKAWVPLRASDVEHRLNPSSRFAEPLRTRAEAVSAARKRADR